MSAVAFPAPGTTAQDAGRRRFGKAEAAFAGVLVLGAVLAMIETRGSSFFGDEWDYVVDRRGLSPHVLLAPHGPHLTLLPILVYKALLALFGAGSYLPFRMLAAVDLVIVALVLGLACRRRWGSWWGLAPVLVLVTLGPGAITLLWPFQVGYSVAIAAGLVSLLALETRWRRRDILCCAALLFSLASGSQGIGFLVGCALMLILAGDWRRVWVVLIPAVLYGLWYLKYGAAYSETHLSLWNVSLGYSMQALSATAAGMVGLTSVGPTTGVLDITFGVPMAVALVAAVAAAAWRGWRPPPLFWGTVITLMVIWVAASMSNFGPFSRPPTDPRYLSSDVTMLVLCICVGTPRPRLSRTGVIVASVVLVIISATNASQYAPQRTSFVSAAVDSRAELGALLLVRNIVAPGFDPALPGDPSSLAGVAAGPYFSAVDAFGTNADSLAVLRAQDEITRERIDGVLERGELSLTPVVKPSLGPFTPPVILSGRARRTAGCLFASTQSFGFDAPAGRYQLTASPQAAIAVTMGRFSSIYDAQIGTIHAGTTAIVSIPSDRAPQIPWRMSVSGARARVCAS